MDNGFIAIRLLDILFYLIYPFIALVVFIASDDKRTFYDRSKRVTAKRQVWALHICYTFGMILFILSYVFVYIEVIVGEVTQLESSLLFLQSSGIPLFVSMFSVASEAETD